MTAHKTNAIVHNRKRKSKGLFEFGGDFMRATGIVRRIDELGRVVIPKEIRRTLRIREGDPLLTTVNEMDVHTIFGVFSSVIESHRIYSRN